ncbi:MAG TPA: c-type cytochrome [Candidatus Limnocylindrales bacterium]|nr:c-type cytochrome [Candidatus Limnocylindrales bacterium]
MRTCGGAAIAICLVLCAACKREERSFRVEPPDAARIDAKRLSELHPGSPPPPTPVHNDYEDNAFAMSEGKRLFNWMNCSGCHAQGGGGMGPPLMDDKWIYGAAPEQVFATIVEGRPNGMPSFKGKIPDNQVWELVAYVRSLSGNVSRNAAPTRDDHINVKQQEQSTPVQPPVASAPPPPPAGK